MDILNVFFSSFSNYSGLQVAEMTCWFADWLFQAKSCSTDFSLPRTEEGDALSTTWPI